MPLILSSCIYARPLSRSLAKTNIRHSKWSFARRFDRAVAKRKLNLSHTHYWWPRRKDGESARDAGSDGVTAEQTPCYSDPDTRPQDTHPKNADARKRVYILGVGNLGCFIAHSLAGIPDRPPTTLLLRPRRFRRWKEIGQSISVKSHGTKETRKGFEAALLEDTPLSDQNDDGSEQDFSDRTGSDARSSQIKRVMAQDKVLRNGGDGAVNALAQVESNTMIGFPVPQTLLDDKLLSEEVAWGPQEPLTQESVINAWFAKTEPEGDEVQSIQHRMPDRDQSRSLDEQEEIIYHLIVSVKAPQTARAIQAIAHRLTQESSIVLLQNGMGIIEELNEKVFPDQKYRPTYIVGVVTHGIYTDGSFSIIHAGEGTIALGVLPRMPVGEALQPQGLNQLALSARYLIRTLTRTPLLVAVGFPPTDLMQQQLDKLAVNCIINPLTAILNCKNGALWSNFYFTRVIRLLLAEISLVIRSLPELENVPNVSMRFDTLRLERLVFSIISTTADNQSSMLQDIRVSRPTEIDYINGYIVRRGEELGIHCVMNYMLMHLVKGKKKSMSLEQTDLLPFVGNGTI